MKHATDYLWFETPNRRDYLNITDRVEEFVGRSGIAHGLCLVSPMHITAAVYVNDAESGLIQDFDDWLERLPLERLGRSAQEAPGSPAPPPLVRFADGPLRGREQVFYADFDGRRRKRVVLKAIGTEALAGSPR